MDFIRFDSVQKNYQLGKVTVPALRGVSFRIDQGDFVTIIGPSGSGKSTLLNLLGLIDAPNAGDVYLFGEKVDFNRERYLTKLRKQYIGFIFQSFNLIPILNIKENIGYALHNSSLTLKERDRKILQLIEMVGLSGLEKRFPNELSGGQRQRVAIARALIHSPQIVLADEPTANLDSETGGLIVELLHRMNQEAKVTFALATHDQAIISRSDHLLKIHDGKIVNPDEKSH